MNKITIEDSHDYVALSWVKDEIVKTLSQAQNALESLADNPQDTTALTSCHDLLHQVSGVLHMVGFPGAALFAEEINKLSEALVNDKVENVETSLQVLMQAILQMPSYLDIIQTEGHDIPIALLPIINEMRSCYKATPLSEVELFSPKYHGAAFPLTDEELNEINTEGLATLLRKVRQSLQLSLIDLIHNRHLDKAFDHLIKIFSYLARLCKATPISILWRVSYALVTGIAEKSIANTLEAKELLKKIDLQMKKLVAQGVSGMNSPAPEDLIKNLLFLLAQTNSQTEAIVSVKQEFHLDNLILHADEVNTDQNKYIHDRTALESVTQALTEEFIKIKDQLDLITRSENFTNVDKESLLDTLKHISSTLEILGLYSQKRIINHQLDLISEAIAADSFDKNQFMDIASAILDVEAVVDGISSGKRVNKIKSTDKNVADDAQAALIKEAANELVQVKDILSLYFDTKGKEGDVASLPELLGHTAGALNIIAQQRAVAVVIRCLQYIEDHLINSSVFPDNKEIDSIVGAIASIDYYMECLAKNHIVSAKDAINFAIKYLNDINYPLPEDYESLAVQYLKTPEPVAESAPTNEQTNSSPPVSEEANKSTESTVAETVDEDEDFDQELVEIFTEEMGEILESLSTTLPAWLANTEDKASLTEVRRSFHTIKGSGRMVKASIIGELGWAIENMLNRVIDKTISASPEVLTLVQNVVKILPELISEFSSHNQHQRADVDYYSAVADALANKQEPPKRLSLAIETDITSPQVETEESKVDVDATDETEHEEIVGNNVVSTESTNTPTDLLKEDTSVDNIATTDVVNEQEIKKNNIESPKIVEAFDVELIDIFIGEAKIHMQALQAFLTVCEHSLPQQVTDELQRAMHTLKGSAAMAGIEVIANIAKPFEGFLKECNINGWPIQRTDLELLQDAFSLLSKGINQLELYSLAPVAGTDALVARINARRDYLLSQLETATVNSQDGTEDSPNLIAVILQDIDQLLAAEDYLKTWQASPTEPPAQLTDICSELAKIAASANQADFKSIAKLCEALLICYEAIKTNNSIIVKDKSIFSVLLNAHQALLSSIDQLAAAQVVSEYPEIIDQLAKITTDAQLANPTKQAEVIELTSEDIVPEKTATDVELTSPTKQAEVIEPTSEDIVPEKTATLANEKVADSTEQSKPTSQVSATTPIEMITPEPANTPDYTIEDKLILGAPAPAGPIITTDDDIDPDMVEIFLEEADEILVEAKQNLDSWLKDQKPDYLHSLQRQLHTLKGGARMCGAKGLGDLAHGLEFIYEGLLNGRYSFSLDLVKLLTAAHNYIQQMVDNLHDKQPTPLNVQLFNAIQIFRKEGRIEWQEEAITNGVAPEVSSTIDSTEAAKDSPTTDHITTSEQKSVTESITEQPTLAVTEQHISKEQTQLQTTEVANQQTTQPLAEVIPLEKKITASVDLKPTPVAKAEQFLNKEHKEAKEQVKVTAELLDNLVNLAGETSIYRSRIEQQNSDLTSTMVEMDVTISRVRDQLRRLDMETQAQIISKHQTENSAGYLEFDPLEMDQYSQIQQLSRSLFESASDLQDLKETLMRRTRDVDTLLQQQGRVNTELQEGLMRTRMVPLERIAPRLRRLVRQISNELGKEAELVIGNTAGEMDRGVIDAIVAPLEHMIRNSLDHGIETKEARLAAGKPAKGIISLNLEREGGEMVLRLKDDGAGIDIAKVRERAIAKGLMGSDEQLTNKEILQFILEAGFSTAKRITQISGRGVGLDVVVTAVKQLGGALSLDSEEGKGTTFSIRLPINLSVSRALMIRVGEDNYAIPMSTVEGVSYISTEQQKEFQQFGTAEIEYGDESYKIKYIGELLGNQHSHLTTGAIEEKLPVLLIRSGEYHIALQVDELLPSSEIVVKSLGTQFLSVPAISGATILGDGRVIIILDLTALVRNYFTNLQNIARMEERRLAVSSNEAIDNVKRPPLVMVVDDSVTVRKVTSRLLERQGMQVITARDGLDAVTQLEEKIPDIMLLDIEMPRMDGFEVATRVRHDEKTKNLPIIMITSRSGEKHRERALAIGVNEYMSKPFMDAKLIKSISDLLPTFEVNLLENN